MYWYRYGGAYQTPAFLNNSPQASMDYWTRSLFQRLTSIIEFENLPNAENNIYAWDKDAFKYQLFMLGYSIIFNSATYGIVCQPGAITGFGLQYQPTHCVVNTPYFHLPKMQIGVECELIKLTPDYCGIFDIIAKYAAELKEIETSIKSAAKNSRLAYALIAKDEKSARTLKNVREKILNGDDVIIDEKILKGDKINLELPWYEFDRDVRNNYILGDLLEARRTTLVDFYREIGVRMLDEKKERMITAEAEASNAENFIRSEVWIECLKESCEKVNKMFDLNIIPILNAPDKLGGGENVL